MNLLAIELLGHGKTRTKSENWTYWDTAYMNLQVLEAVGIPKAFVLGTSQGGWITGMLPGNGYHWGISYLLLTSCSTNGTIGP